MIIKMYSIPRIQTGPEENTARNQVVHLQAGDAKGFVPANFDSPEKEAFLR
jgi:hypothetical protein